MSTSSSSRMPIWSWATRRRPLNHWSKGSFSGRLECHGSGWIPDLTRCETIQGFGILSAESEFLEPEDQSLRLRTKRIAERRVLLEVADNGPGISPTIPCPDLRSLFHPANRRALGPGWGWPSHWALSANMAGRCTF